jgi:hypothetical protein
MSAATAQPISTWLANRQAEDEDYKKLRDELEYSDHHKPTAYR